MTRLRTAVLAVTAGALAITATACSSSSAPSNPNGSSPAGTSAPASARTSAPARATVTIHTTDRLRFQPSVVTVAGTTVKIQLVNDGSYPHNLRVPALNYTSHTVSGNLGEQHTSFTLHFPKPGTYDFECTYHASAGMRGQFIVH